MCWDPSLGSSLGTDSLALEGLEVTLLGGAVVVLDAIALTTHSSEANLI